MNDVRGFTNEDLAEAVQALGRRARATVGAEDLVTLRRLKWSTRTIEWIGRALLLFVATRWGLVLGCLCLAYYFSVEAQLNHSIMHGAYAKLRSAGRFTPRRYETLAIPFQSKTWRDAHHIHHAHPSIVDQDPDTTHALFRVHPTRAFRPWHRFNAFIGAILVFEQWAFDYDRFLMAAGKRRTSDRGELRKFAIYIGYQLLWMPLCAGPRWAEVLCAVLAAILIRNLIFTALQTASSVGHRVSTAHAVDCEKRDRAAHLRFQVETSKNFMLHGIWRLLSGGLDRHIEHHLFPDLPPGRLHGLSNEVRSLCQRHGIDYAEYGSVWTSLEDSVSYLHQLSRSSA